MSRLSINQIQGQMSFSDYTDNTNKSKYGNNLYSNTNYYGRVKEKEPVFVEIKNSNKTYSGISGFIKSQYDPRLIEIIKSSPERYWHNDIKQWEVADTYLNNIIDKIKQIGYDVEVTNNCTQTTTQQYNAKIDIPSDYVFKTPPIADYQRDGVLYGINNAKFLLGDEQGLGKTWQAINIACIRKQLFGFKHCLIICCVNPNKYNWEEEVVTHSFEKGYILGTRYRKTTGKRYIGSGQDKLDDLCNMNDSFFQIINIEALRYSKQVEKTLKTGRVKKETTYPIAEQIKHLIDIGDIGYVIVDEIHKCLSADTLISTEAGYIPISELVNNEINHTIKVLSYNTSNNTFEYIKPINWFKNPITKELMELTFKDGAVTTKIKCTPTHKIYTLNRGFICAKDITETDNVKGNGIIVKLVSKNTVHYSDYVYDIEVPNIHNYVANNIVVHNCKDSTSQQGKALLSIGKKDDGVFGNVGMSGTLLLNTPVDLYTPLKFVNAENHSLTAFKQHYCVFGGFGGHQIVNYRNLGELQTLLDSVMLRRLKKDKLNLPPKIEVIKYVELAKDQQAIYDEIKEETQANIERNIDKVKINMTPLTMFTRMRQCTGNPNILTSKEISNAKFDMLKDIVTELNSNNEKFIVFSNWTSVLNGAYEFLQSMGLNPALYTGENTDIREQEKERFRKDDKCRCICGTIGAMGTGVTLTEATTVIFLDEPWNRGIKEQAEDRAYRIGTTSTVTIITIIAKDTIDEKLHELVYKKGKMSDIIVDKEVDAVTNEKMVQFLLS